MAKDKYHDIVKSALEKEKWMITNDPLQLKEGNVELFIDLGGERIIGAKKGTEKIAVEIKTFSQISLTYAFHGAIGQYISYKTILKEQEPDRSLYLAVPTDVYEQFRLESFFKKVIKSAQVSLIVYDSDLKCIEQWIK